MINLILYILILFLVHIFKMLQLYVERTSRKDLYNLEVDLPVVIKTTRVWAVPMSTTRGQQSHQNTQIRDRKVSGSFSYLLIYLHYWQTCESLIQLMDW